MLNPLFIRSTASPKGGVYGNLKNRTEQRINWRERGFRWAFVIRLPEDFGLPNSIYP